MSRVLLEHELGLLNVANSSVKTTRKSLQNKRNSYKNKQNLDITLRARMAERTRDYKFLPATCDQNKPNYAGNMRNWQHWVCSSGALIP